MSTQTEFKNGDIVTVPVVHKTRQWIVIGQVPESDNMLILFPDDVPLYATGGECINVQANYLVAVPTYEDGKFYLVRNPSTGAVVVRRYIAEHDALTIQLNVPSDGIERYLMGADALEKIEEVEICLDSN